MNNTADPRARHQSADGLARHQPETAEPRRTRRLCSGCTPRSPGPSQLSRCGTFQPSQQASGDRQLAVRQRRPDQAVERQQVRSISTTTDQHHRPDRPPALDYQPVLPRSTSPFDHSMHAHLRPVSPYMYLPYDRTIAATNRHSATYDPRTGSRQGVDRPPAQQARSRWSCPARLLQLRIKASDVAERNLCI